MRIFFRLSILLLLLAFSCGEKKPSGVLSFEEMRSVMWDMMRADQFMADHIFSRDSLANKTVVSSEWYGKVLALHKLSQENFRKSYEYYSTHPKLMQTLMDSISRQTDTSAIWQPRIPDSSRKEMKKAVAQ